MTERSSNQALDADERTLVVPAHVPPDSIRVQKCKLLAVSGPHQGREFVIDKDIFAIGSGPHNDLRLEDSTISRRHCEIRLLPEGPIIRDLGSTNGTLVQGVRVAKAFLNPGTEFQLGNTRVVFCPLRESIEYALSASDTFGALLGKSVSMRRVFHMAEMYAQTEATILIEGETGTGKEILAQAIHKHSSRRAKPFIIIDCAALARELIESELFGHTKGAFTGANAERVGAFEHASGGTVFLDEIGDLSPDLQPKLLRVLEKRQIRRVGSNQVRDVDVRIVSATNRRLDQEVNAGRFREDLFYRLSVVHITMPPLRDHRRDIPALAERFLKEFLGENALTEIDAFDAAMDAFQRHDWPGNVRELRNVLETAAYSARRPIDLAAFLHAGRLKERREPATPEHSADRPFKEVKGEIIRTFEQDYIRSILRKHQGNVSQAAREAGIERAYLQRLLKKYGLRP